MFIFLTNEFNLLEKSASSGSIIKPSSVTTLTPEAKASIAVLLITSLLVRPLKSK